jgi:hypothetical protein
MLGGTRFWHPPVSKPDAAVTIAAILRDACARIRFGIRQEGLIKGRGCLHRDVRCSSMNFTVRVNRRGPTGIHSLSLLDASRSNERSTKKHVAGSSAIQARQRASCMIT